MESPSDGLLFTLFLECRNYKILSSADRKVTYRPYHRLCDGTLGHGWFRFQGDAGTKMPTWCTPTYRCGSLGTGWLNGAHPQEHEGSKGVFSLSSFLLSLPEEYSSEELQWVLRVLPHSNHMQCSLLWHRLRKNWTLIIWK